MYTAGGHVLFGCSRANEDGGRPCRRRLRDRRRHAGRGVAFGVGRFRGRRRSQRQGHILLRRDAAHADCAHRRRGLVQAWRRHRGEGRRDAAGVCARHKGVLDKDRRKTALASIRREDAFRHARRTPRQRARQDVGGPCRRKVRGILAARPRRQHCAACAQYGRRAVRCPCSGDSGRVVQAA